MEQSSVWPQSSWKAFYRTAAVLALLIVLVGLVDTITSMLGGEARANSAISVVEWFSLFQNSRFHAFSYLGFINIVTLTLAIPIYLALFHAHWRMQPAFAALAAACFLIGAGVYFSSNTVFSMFALSQQYAAAAEAQKTALETAGITLLAHGADLTPGTFMGFFFTQVAGLLMTGVMIRAGLFGKWVGWLGLAGYVLTSIFFVLTAFVPKGFSLAMILVMPGGIVLMIYHILLARGFFRLAGQL